MGKYNDIDLKNWKDYDFIDTNSLWVIEKRDSSGVHSANYHGNFIPQIPHQLLWRYTCEGDWVLDPFLGGGTTLIEAQRLRRNGIGVELQQSVAEATQEIVDTEKCDGVTEDIYIGDSRTIDFQKILAQSGTDSVQFVILHPPYWDIIKFSEDPNDLSNTATLDDFLEAFGQVVDNACSVLEKNRYCAVVIGDKYANSEIVPLGFYCMELMRRRGYKHKATIVKNFDSTKGKANQHGIWRYRALSNDFYVFKHEYIFVFKKV